MAPKGDNLRKIFVTGYPGYTQSQDLIKVFSEYGTVKVEKLNSRFAVLVFNTEDEAKEAIHDSNKVNIYGEFLTVNQFSGKTEPGTPKREFPMSKEKDTIVEPRLIDLSGDFHQQLDALLAAVRLAQREVTALAALYADLQRALEQTWPGCVALPFGSITTGLGIKTSDADCFIDVPPNLRHPNANYVGRAKRVLQQYPKIFAEILAIPRANTPIVKFFHIPTETNCDVTFKTPLGVQNSKLIAFLLHADPRLIPMAVVIKYWSKVHGLSGTGKLTNYALTMLIIFYLQQPPVSILPSVEWLQRDRENDVIVDYWNTGFMHRHDHLPKSTNTSSISELLGGFFQYYSTFNFDEMVVCPFLGSPIKKELFKDLNLLPNEFERYIQNVQNRRSASMRFTTSMCIQDPFELCHNVASAITSRLSLEMKAFFKFAATAYDKEKLNNCEGLFKIILLQKPKLPRGKLHPEFRAVIYPNFLQNIESPDWKSVIRDVTMKVFEEICKIKLTKDEEKVNDTARKQKEKYVGFLTKAIWKRKQFSKLYDHMRHNFVEKQTRITEEILNVEKDTYNVQFRLILIFTHEPKNAAASIKMMEGDAVVFREFGKFFTSIMQNWFFALLKPYLQIREKKADVSVSGVINNAEDKNESDKYIQECEKNAVASVPDVTNNEENINKSDKDLHVCEKNVDISVPDITNSGENINESDKDLNESMSQTDECDTSVAEEADASEIVTDTKT